MNIPQTIQSRSLTVADTLDALAVKAKAATTPATLGAVASDAGRLIQQIAGIRVYLDALDVGATFAKAIDILNAGAWERDTRLSLVLSHGTARRVLDTATRMADRTPSTVRRHIVKAGETPMSIARMELGDWRRWADILAANALDPASNLTVGASLIIPTGAGQ